LQPRWIQESQVFNSIASENSSPGSGNLQSGIPEKRAGRSAPTEVDTNSCRHSARNSTPYEDHEGFHRHSSRDYVEASLGAARAQLLTTSGMVPAKRWVFPHLDMISALFPRNGQPRLRLPTLMNRNR